MAPQTSMNAPRKQTIAVLTLVARTCKAPTNANATPDIQETEQCALV